MTLLSERRIQGPRGAAGGEDGSPGENVLIRGGREERLPGKVTFDALVGDIISVRSPGGGGWGESAEGPATVAAESIGEHAPPSGPQGLRREAGNREEGS